VKRQNFSLDEASKTKLARLAQNFGGNESEAIRQLLAAAPSAPLFWQQLQALALDLDEDREGVVTLAITQLWQRESGDPDRDVLAELDELKADIAELKRRV